MEETKTKTKLKLPMSCTCSHEDRRHANKKRKKTLKSLTENYEGAKGDFVSCVIASLWWDFGYTVEGIYMDMWYGISVSGKDETLFIECDRVEDGLTDIWQYLNYKKHKK